MPSERELLDLLSEIVACYDAVEIAVLRQDGADIEKQRKDLRKKIDEAAALTKTPRRR